MGFRRALGLLLIVALVSASSAVVATNPTGASLTCGFGPWESAIDDAVFAVIGEEVDWRTEERGSVPVYVLTIEVTEVLKGQVPARIEVEHGMAAAGLGGTSGSIADRGPTGLLVFEYEPGRYSLSTCGGINTPEQLRSFFEPLTATSDRPPAHILGYPLGGARVAVVDADGDVIAYGPGEGTLNGLDVCPGTERVVELALAPIGEGRWQGEVAVRDLATMEILGTREVEAELDAVGRAVSASGWMRDLQCLDREGTEVSYLVVGGRRLPTVHHWVGDDLSEYELVDQQRLAVAPAAGRFYTLGTNGRNLFTWDLETGEGIFPFRELPGFSVGWDLAVQPDGSEIAILGRRSAVDGPDTWYPESDRVFVGPPDGELGSFPLDRSGRALGIAATPFGYAATVGDVEDDRATTFLVESGVVMEVAAAPDKSPGAVSVGVDSVLYSAVEWRPLLVGFVDGVSTTIDGPASAVIAAAPIDASEAPTIRSATLSPPPFVATGEIVAVRPGSGQGGDALLLAAVVAAVTTVAIGAAVLMARRRHLIENRSPGPD